MQISKLLVGYILMVIMFMGFGIPSAQAKPKKKKKVRIVHIKMEAPRKVTRKPRPKREKPLLVDHTRSHSVEIEPLKKGQKLSNFGLAKERLKKKKRKHQKRSIASQAVPKNSKKGEMVSDGEQLKDSDLDQILMNMKGSTEMELAIDYDGSF